MSLYIAWLNQIKERADETWLTESQRQVYDHLLSKWRSQLFVNLFGVSGVGKSFIARLLARYHDYVYTHQLGEVPPGSANVVVDDADYSRLLRPLARDLGVGRVLLVTRSEIRETMPKIELTLSQRDVQQFCTTLSDKCGISLLRTLPEGHDLGEILRKEAIARGASHVHQRP